MCASIAGLCMLKDIDSRLREVRADINAPLGGVRIILAGDAFQLRRYKDLFL